jgi:hypothetical protein
VEFETIRSILSWDQIDIGNDDAAFVTRLNHVVAGVRSDDLRAALEERMEIRTLIAALRRRHAGEEAPAPGTVWASAAMSSTSGQTGACPTSASCGSTPGC